MRERTTVHFSRYTNADLFIGGRTPSERGHPDITVELSDWGMPVRKRRSIAAQLTLQVAELFAVEAENLDALNIRFHPYPLTEFAVGGRLLSDIVPQMGQVMKRIFG